MASNVCKIRVSSASSAVSSDLTTYLQSYQTATIDAHYLRELFLQAWNIEISSPKW